MVAIPKQASPGNFKDFTGAFRSVAHGDPVDTCINMGPKNRRVA